MSNESGTQVLTPQEHMLLGLSKQWQQVYRHLAVQLEREFLHWRRGRNRPETVPEAQWLVQQVASFLEFRAADALALLDKLDEGYRGFTQRYQGAGSAMERQQHLLAYAAELGQTRRGLRADRRALDRWFDESALRDRYQRKVSEEQRLLTFCVNRLNANVCHFLEHYTRPQDVRMHLNSLNNPDLIEQLLTRKLDHRVTTASLSLLSGLLDVSSGVFGEFIEPQILQYCFRLSNDPDQPLWLQAEALRVTMSLDTDASLGLAQERFEQQDLGDRIFFRARILSMMLPVQDHHKAQALYHKACQDPSEHVRQGLVRVLPELAGPLSRSLIESLIEKESCDRVRARLIRIMPDLVQAGKCTAEKAWKVLQPCLNNQVSSLLVRAALAALVDLSRMNADIAGGSDEPEQLLSALHTGHEETSVRRAAAQTRERLWASRQELVRSSLFRPLKDLHWQQRTRVRLEDNAVSDEDLGRLLASLAENQFGYDVARRGRKLAVTGGSRYQFRSWRFLHEFRTSASDKRQNYNHTKGRVYHGNMQVPAWHLAELSETSVPGEPLHIAEDGDWRPYLPLMDQILSSLDQGWPTRPVEIYTSEGITRIHPPRGLAARLRARLIITLRFSRLSRLRNWRESSTREPEAYLEALEKLGFRFELSGYLTEGGQRHQTDPRVRRFFPGLASIAPLPVLLQDFRNYFYSVYENNLQHLVMFILATATVFFGRHIYIGHQMKKARANLPFVVGGWGTRGKSGTERLKAALFNAEGLSVVSKTTGCEAMFLYSPANGSLREMFLFRPYDKASIWEQVDLVRLASKFQTDVFLWECMGLTPRYVQILQEQWMRDDVATITNCYPDHEDIQGPSGIEIPRVMQKFVPKRSQLLTTEHNMYPFLRAAAQSKGSDIIKVEEWESELLPADVLDRFPYEEHPLNIALVLRMADELGLEADYALKEMADRVVPDLGVLKIYPRVNVRGRHLTFINGMSANERHAALANWRRLKMDEYHPTETPDAWIVTVINNRADRVPRSQVFARMLVQDLSADRHFLIGTNLDGLQSYIDHAWQQRLESESFADQDRQALLEALDRYAHQLRVVTTDKALLDRTQAMLRGLGHTPPPGPDSVGEQDTLAQFCDAVEMDSDIADGVLAHWQENALELTQFRELQQALESGSGGYERLQDVLSVWFKRRVVVLPNSHATGDEVIRDIVGDTPPGLETRMMGMQNIKGTGLDFIYRWQSWDRHYQDGRMLLSRDPDSVLAAARNLAAVEDFGWLDFDYFRPLLVQAMEMTTNQTQAIQSELEIIRSRLEQRRAELQKTTGSEQQTAGKLERIFNGLEAVLDAGAAVKRRKRANQIYKDLTSQRISHERAALELKDINRSQKGGWLKRRFLAT
jgi:poly-gamma-glutamate synthase PgsB/CapB